jgi:hypothetical protein
MNPMINKSFIALVLICLGIPLLILVVGIFPVTDDQPGTVIEKAYTQHPESWTLIVQTADGSVKADADPTDWADAQTGSHVTVQTTRGRIFHGVITRRASLGSQISDFK